MGKTEFTNEVENLKCVDCVIIQHIAQNKLNIVFSANTDAENAPVLIEYRGSNELPEKAIKEKLDKIAYPIKDTGNNFQKAKSYVICAVSKFSDKAYE